MWAMMQSYLNRDYSVLQQNGRHTILSYFQTDYTIVWFYWCLIQACFCWVLTQTGHRLHLLKTLGLMLCSMIWGVRIAIFTEIRHLVEELITVLSFFGPHKLGILTARQKSLKKSQYQHLIQWEGISVLKHVQNLHNYCKNNSFWKTLW